jgi:hypothetical protein
MADSDAKLEQLSPSLRAGKKNGASEAADFPNGRLL